MALATDGVNVLGSGHYPTTGSIDPISGAYPGVVYYSGELTVGPDELPAGWPLMADLTRARPAWRSSSVLLWGYRWEATSD
jgi:hypothetical protein